MMVEIMGLNLSVVETLNFDVRVLMVDMLVSKHVSIQRA
jgi:hypothetical protein